MSADYCSPLAPPSSRVDCTHDHSLGTPRALESLLLLPDQDPVCVCVCVCGGCVTECMWRVKKQKRKQMCVCACVCVWGGGGGEEVVHEIMCV